MVWKGGGPASRREIFRDRKQGRARPRFEVQADVGSGRHSSWAKLKYSGLARTMLLRPAGERPWTTAPAKSWPSLPEGPRRRKVSKFWLTASWAVSGDDKKNNTSWERVKRPTSSSCRQTAISAGLPVRS